MADKWEYILGGAALLFCITYLVATVMSFNCAADKKWQCAQVSGILGGVSFCIMCSVAAACLYHFNKRGNSSFVA
jgi:hypothetical protein